MVRARYKYLFYIRLYGQCGGANALLKNLEEPPAHSVFLLVSHAPERLLPTIRSRCRILRLGPLDDDAMASALRAAAPECPPAGRRRRDASRALELIELLERRGFAGRGFGGAAGQAQ